MIVRFIARDGTVTLAAASPGDRLLDAAQAHDQPLEGTCEGQLSCATCHVIVDPEMVTRLPAMTDEENDLLDSLDHRTPTSRLSCQIPFDETLDGLRVTIGPED